MALGVPRAGEIQDTKNKLNKKERNQKIRGKAQSPLGLAGCPPQIPPPQIDRKG